MDDAALVGVLHGLSEGFDHVGGVARRLGFAMDLGIQTAAAHEFQREKGQAVVLTVFVDLKVVLGEAGDVSASGLFDAHIEQDKLDVS